MYDYKILIYDASGNKLHYTAEQESNQFDAAMVAEEWATRGGVDVDWVDVVESDDPNVLINTGKW